MRTFGVIGCGSIGRRHMRNLASLQAGDVVAFDPRADRREQAEQELGVRTVATLDELWALGPDAVLVTAPTALHVPLALDAAERGIHLFIEKPLSADAKDIDRLARTVRDRGLVTLVGCNMRFHPSLRQVRDLVASGALGRIAAVRIEVGHHLPDWHPWEDYRQTYSARSALGGGVVLDDIHEIDYARWMFGEVAEVAAMVGHQSALEIDVEDTAAILLRFENGTFGELHLDYVQRASSRSCHVIGGKGTARWDIRSNSVATYLASDGNWQTRTLPADWDSNSIYVDEMRHFLDCLDGKARPEVDVADAARTLSIALAVKRSAATSAFVKPEVLT